MKFAMEIGLYKEWDGYNIKSSGFKVACISDMVYFGDLQIKV